MYYGSFVEWCINVVNVVVKIDGMVVVLGENFSFFQLFGGISFENGFVGGLIISGGCMVDGFGGGVCQVSIMVFWVLYQVGLFVVECNQYFYCVKYYELEVGFEVVVYDFGVDFKMKNDIGVFILICMVNNNNVSCFEIQVWGIKLQCMVSVLFVVIFLCLLYLVLQYVFNFNLFVGVSKQVDWVQDGYNFYIICIIKDVVGVCIDWVDIQYKFWQVVYEYGFWMN